MFAQLHIQLQFGPYEPDPRRRACAVQTVGYGLFESTAVDALELST